MSVRCSFCLCVYFTLHFSTAIAQHADRWTPAARQTPTVSAWEKLKLGMFIHFGMNTYDGGLDYDTLHSPASTFNPKKLNADQWIQVAKECGMTYAVLTVKHSSGFCLWDSEDYSYDVASSGNKTDIVRDFVNACQKQGLRFGFYYCILDASQNNGWAQQVSPEYFKQIKKHLTELHNRYPGALEQWIDIPSNCSQEQLGELYVLIKELSPRCLVVLNQMTENSYRLQGTQVGKTGNVSLFPTDVLNLESALPPPAGHNPTISFNGRRYYLPLEVCDNGGENYGCGSGGNWFHTNKFKMRSAEQLLQLYDDVTSRGANLLLNVPPNADGLIPDQSIQELKRFRMLVEQR